MARHELNEHDVVTHLSRQKSPASLRELARALGLRGSARKDLKKVVSKLKRRGEIEQTHSGRYLLAGGKPAGKGPSPPKRPAAATGHPGAVRQRDPHLVMGRLVAHRDGYGFVVPDEPVAGMEGDLFVGREKLGDAMHADRVLARIERRGRGPDTGRAEGRVVQVLQRAHPTVVGVFRYGPRGNTVMPYEERIEPIIIPPGEELTLALRAKLGPQAGRRGQRLLELDGAVVDVELTRYPRGGVAPAGRVVEILGRLGDFGVDVEIIIRKHRLPYRFPAEVADAARAVPQHVREEERAGRQDFRALPIVTIDGETARDFDDAVYVERRPDGYHLQVHIADVAHYVPRGSALDREARLRGTSVYFPDRAVPMLPEALSSEICSLKPQVDRLVMSVLMDFSADGQMRDARFTAGVIRSVERMTYTDVNRALQGDEEMTARYAPLLERFRLMRELALLLNARRMRRGSIDFDLPEPVIEFDELGRMTRIVRSERNIAHRIIEEFMLAANQAVARHLERRGIASLHRVHEKPDPKKVLEFEEIARAFGYSLGVADLAERRIPVKHGRIAAKGRLGQRQRQMTIALPADAELQIRPQHYQRLVEKIAGKPEERILSYLMLRSLKQARYAAEPLGHFALALDSYTHFTSPIRRYPDLIVHRVLKSALAGPETSPGRRTANPARHGPKVSGQTPARELATYRVVELEEIAAESSEAERRADAAERELMDWKTAQFMEAHLGEEFDALIISVQKFGCFVELLDIFVEGLVPMAALEEAVGQRCFFRERDRAIVTEKRRAFRLGDRVRVRADRIDPFRRRVEFALVS